MGTFTTPRRIDWPVRFTEFMKDSLDLALELKLDWEFVSCTSFVGDGIEAITDENPFDPYRDQFKDAIGAARVIKQAGFSTLDDLIASAFDEVPVGMAQTGDVVLVKSMQPSDVMPHGLGLVDPPLFFAVNEEGLGKGDLYVDGFRAFKVGRT